MLILSLTAILLFSGFGFGPSVSAMADPEDLDGESAPSHSIPLDHEDDPVPEAPFLLPICEGAGEDTLVGTVTNETGDPVDHIRITAYAQGSSAALLGALYTRTTTNQDGVYGLELAEGNYLVTAVDEQIPPEYQPVYRGNVQVRCEEVQTEDFELSGEAEPPELPELPEIPGLPGPGVLEAHVSEIVENTDLKRPIGEGLQVEISLPNPTEELACQYASIAANRQDTNEDSNVTFNNLVPGYYCLRMVETNWDAGEVQDIQVEGDTTAEAEMESFKDRIKDLTGTVEDSLSLAGIEGAFVNLTHAFYCPDGERPAGAHYECATVTDEDGDYDFDEQPWDENEDYKIEVSRHDYDDYTAFFEMELPRDPPQTPGTQREDVEMVRSLVRVTGSVTDAAAAALDFEATVVHHQNLYDDRAEFNPPVTVGSDGSFDALITWADYHVTIENDGKTTYRCVTIGPEGREFEPFNPVADGGSLFQGVITDNQSSSGAGVEAVVIIEDNQGDRCITKSGEDGKFSKGLLEGTYEMSFWEEDRVERSDEVEHPAGGEVEFGLDWLTREIEGSVRLSELFGTQFRALVDSPAAVQNFLGSVDNVLNPVEAGVEIICTTDDAQELEIRSVTTDNTTNNLDLHLPRENLFMCGVEEGVYYEVSPVEVNVPRTSNSGFDTLDLIVEKRLWEITGTVSDAITGEPLEGARVFESAGVSPVFQLNERTDENGTYSFTVQIEEGPEGIKANQIVLLVDHVNYVPEMAVITIGSHPGATGVKDFSLIPEGVGIPPIDDPLQSAMNTYCDEDEGLHIHGSDIDGECVNDDEDHEGDWTWYPPGDLPPVPPEE